MLSGSSDAAFLLYPILRLAAKRAAETIPAAASVRNQERVSAPSPVFTAASAFSPYLSSSVLLSVFSPGSRLPDVFPFPSGILSPGSSVIVTNAVPSGSPLPPLSTGSAVVTITSSPTASPPAYSLSMIFWESPPMHSSSFVSILPFPAIASPPGPSFPTPPIATSFPPPETVPPFK